MNKLQQLEEQLEVLRREWIENYAKRDIIKRQARALKISKEKILEKTGQLGGEI